jgi:enterochelin esterase-like enzyme
MPRAGQGSRNSAVDQPQTPGYLAERGRDLRIDFLRGYLVFAMVVDHVRGPSWLYVFTGGNRFFTSAAEGFIFISGFVAGMVYRRQIERDGLGRALDRVLERTAQLYLLAVGLTLAFVPLSEVLALPWARGVDVGSPLSFVVSVFTLHRTYYLVDVPLLYSLLLLIAPLALVLVSQGQTAIVLGASWLLWGLYQLFPEYADLPWPIDGNYLFHFSAWQVLFFTGLAIGYHRDRVVAILGPLPQRGMLALSGLGTAALVVLHLLGDPFVWQLSADAANTAAAHQDLYLRLFDALFAKADLRPGRLVAFGVVFGFLFLLVTVLWRPLHRALGWLFLPLGQHALHAYTWHVVVAFAVALVLRPFDLPNPGPQALNTVVQLSSVLLIWLLVQARVLAPSPSTMRYWMASPAALAAVLLLVRPGNPAYQAGPAGYPADMDSARARVARAFGTPLPRGTPPVALGTPVPLPSRQATPGQLMPGGEPRASAYVGPIQGSLREMEFYSAALDRDVSYFIYLPPEYAKAGRRYPVLYMLHGASGDKEEWLAYGLVDVADQAFKSGELEPLLIVLPQGDFSYWTNHAADGPRWGDYLAADLVRHIDASYRTLRAPESRAIGGLSMGGWGALHQAFGRPDVFGIVGAHSPALRTDDGSIAFVGVGDEFTRKDPLRLAHTAPSLERLQIWIDIGEDDPWIGRAALLHQALDERRVSHEWVVFPGGHDGTYWQSHTADYLRFYGRATTRR